MGLREEGYTNIGSTGEQELRGGTKDENVWRTETKCWDGGQTNLGTRESETADRPTDRPTDHNNGRPTNSKAYE